MKQRYYVGLDVHKRTISYCVKNQVGEIVQEGRIGASRQELEQWQKGLPDNWVGAMEATLFTGWIYDQLTEQGAEIKVADPSMLKAITCSKKRNDRIDARKLADAATCCQPLHGAAPDPELRRILRWCVSACR